MRSIACLLALCFWGGAPGARPASPAPPVLWAVPGVPDNRLPAQGYPPLRGVETFSIYHATPDTGVYSHHAQIAWWHGRFFASWSNQRWGEDGPGQRVLCSISGDGRHWQKPFLCFPSMGTMKNPDTAGRVLTAEGWVSVGNRLYVIAEANDRAPRGVKHWPTPVADARFHRPYFSGRLGLGRLARSISVSGKPGPIFWLVPDPPGPVDHKPQFPGSSDRRFHAVAAAIHRWWQNPLHLPAWDFRFGTASGTGNDGHHLCEPAVYRRPDGIYVKLFRDCTGGSAKSLRLYASTSRDGRFWTTPVRTNIPDSPSKPTSGMLPDGRIFLIGNQVSRQARPRRDPLVLSLSSDGIHFTWAAAIRSGAPPVRYPGRAKIPGFQYPSAVVARHALWVIYSIGKEDVAVSRIPLASLP